MSQSRLIVLALAAGTICPLSALAQEIPLASEMQQIFLRWDGTSDTSPYSDRAVGAVFNNGFTTAAGGFINGVGIPVTHIMEDFSFVGGPWAPSGQPAPTGRRVTGFGFAMQSTGCAGTTAWDALVEIFAGNQADYGAVNMTSPGGAASTPLFTARYALGGTCGFATLWTINLRPAGAPDVSFVWPDGVNTGFMRIRMVATGTTTLRPYPTAGTGAVIDSFVFGTGQGSHSLGVLTPDFGYDRNGNGATLPASGLEGGNPVIVGAAAGAHEHRRTSATLNTGEIMLINGEIPSLPPANTVPLGDLNNGVRTENVTVPANGVAWYSFGVGVVEGDPSRTFLDIDTEGSTGVAATSIAFYDGQGNLFTTDVEDGSGTLSQMTFGICRRPAVGDGRQYDGRDGDLLAGTYYVGVGPAGTAWAAGFTAAVTNAGGAARLNINTNASPLGSVPPPPSIPPAVDSANDFGTVMPPGAQGAPIAAGPRDVTWYKFTVPARTSSTTYLDIDLVPTVNTTDTMIGLFNSAGDVLAQDDDDNDEVLSMLTFGGSSGPRPANGNGLPFDGRDGDLNPGTYYLATGLFFSEYLPGWCARTNSGSNLEIQVTLTTNITGSTCHGACPADFDDGSGTGVPDGAVGLEDLLYYLGIFDAGVVCADLDDGSGTGNQDGGVGIDDLLYFLVRFELGC